MTTASFLANFDLSSSTVMRSTSTDSAFSSTPAADAEEGIPTAPAQANTIEADKTSAPCQFFRFMKISFCGIRAHRLRRKTCAQCERRPLYAGGGKPVTTPLKILII